MSFYPGQLVRFKSSARFVALIVAVEKRSYANSLLTMLTVFVNGKLHQYHEDWFTKVSC